MNSAERFSSRVAHYVKYRPGYPPEVLELFRNEMGLTEHSVLADIGSGTGISSRMFVESGATVYGVEPNDAMRAAAEETFAGYPNYHSRNGWAEETGLENDSVDFAVAAQAFHWFDPETTRAEFIRILRPEGFIVLIWNERQLDTTPFLTEYERFLEKYATDYSEVRHENVTDESLTAFFPSQFKKAVFANSQRFEPDGLMGRVLSSSYMPMESDDRFPAMKNELIGLFAKHAENGKIELLYDTTVYYAQI